MNNSTDWNNLTKPGASAGPLNQPQDLRNSSFVAAIQIPAHIRQRLIDAKLTCDKDGLLLLHQKSKLAIQEATAFEMELRKLTVEMLVDPATKKEGVNNIELGEGYVAKVGIKYNYNLVPPEGKNKVDAVDDLIDDFVKIDNEGSFIAERLFKWSVDMSVTEYRKLEEDAKGSPTKAALLARLRKLLQISEAAPTLEIKEPKVKK